MIKRLALFVLTSICLVCQSNSPTAIDNGGGNTSETTNGVTLSRSGPGVQGRTRPYVFVGIYSSDFVPPHEWGTADSVRADSAGAFSFDSLANGTYNLIARDSATITAVLHNNVVLDSDAVFIPQAKDFSPTGTLDGLLRDHDSTVFPFSYCFLVGTPFHTVSDDNGYIRYDDLPSGTYTVGIPTLSASQSLGQPGTYEEKQLDVVSDSLTTW